MGVERSRTQTSRAAPAETCRGEAPPRAELMSGDTERPRVWLVLPPPPAAPAAPPMGGAMLPPLVAASALMEEVDLLPKVVEVVLEELFMVQKLHF